MAKPKRSIASLVGGVAVASGVLVLWLLLAGSLRPGSIAVGLVLAAAVGAWVPLPVGRGSRRGTPRARLVFPSRNGPRSARRNGGHGCSIGQWCS